MRNWLLGIFTAVLLASGGAQAKPNIIVIMTDDQDAYWSLSAMPNVNKLLISEGVSFENSFVVAPTCGPSRAAFLTGQYPHNNGSTNNFNAYRAFSTRETDALPVWLDAAGYTTSMLGKFVNGYGEAEEAPHIPPGWDDWHVIVGGAQVYYDYKINDNGVINVHRRDADDYSTTVIETNALKFIESQSSAFYLQISVVAPHISERGELPIPAPGDAGTWKNRVFHARANFNERNVSDKPGFLRTLPLLTGLEIEKIEHLYRSRQESLVSVDRLVGKIIRALSEQGKLENTIVALTSDNGFSLGSHRWITKGVVYEESIRVPLFIRGPGIARNEKRRQLVTNVDLTATIVQWANATPTSVLDGRSLVPVLANPDERWRSAILTERIEESTPSFVALRSKRYIYAKYDNRRFGFEEEFYDFRADPFQLTNSINGLTKYGLKIEQLRRGALDLENCKGTSCWYEKEFR